MPVIFDITAEEVVEFSTGVAVAFISGIADKDVLDGGAGMMTPEALSNALSGETHSETRGKFALNIFCAALIALNGGGSTGSERSNPISQEMETLASTRARGPSLIRSLRKCVVLFAYGGAGGAVALLLLPQFSAMLLESFASRRGSSREAVTSAFN